MGLGFLHKVTKLRHRCRKAPLWFVHVSLPRTRDLRTQAFRAVNLGWVSGSKALSPAHQLYRRLTSYLPSHLMVPEAVKKSFQSCTHVRNAEASMRGSRHSMEEVRLICMFTAWYNSEVAPVSPTNRFKKPRYTYEPTPNGGGVNHRSETDLETYCSCFEGHFWIRKI